LTPEDIQKLYGTEEGTTFLRNLFGGVLPAVVVFCGDNGNVNLPNSQCPQQVPAWSTNPIGGEVYFIPYQGDKSITGDFATNTLNIPNDVPVIIIGYSAGAEPALIYAVDRISQGGKIQAVVLLGPTFSGADRNGTDLGFSSSSGGWKEYMDIISNYGGDIIIVDDQDGHRIRYFCPILFGLNCNDHTAAWDYAPPAGASGSFVYIISQSQHYADPVNPGPYIGTNTNTYLSGYIYGLIIDLAQ
jgi:hypothetical protein